MFSQTPYRYRLEWGSRGAREAAERGDVVVIVDTLSFSSAVIAAVQAGMEVYPLPTGVEATLLARRVGAEVAVHRREVPGNGRYSLSPLTFLDGPRGNRVVLPSLNGSMCSAIANHAPAVLIGAPLNAHAVASYVSQLQQRSGLPVTVIACGEHWVDVRGEENWLRPAIEDYLGAGAILSYLTARDLSPEAEVCRAAFLGSRERLGTLIWECGSGRELRERGFEADVRYAARLDVCEVIPLLVDGAFKDASMIWKNNDFII
ncbi:2-phosphosulfolactate phosphatase [Candidatus Poribacteria bacterium]|nr:2-phosphosulfolactate phosphatase [Candidatus Poribacteria bacterium]